MIAVVLSALLWTLLVAVTPAYAVPPPPPNPSDEQINAADAAEQAAAAEVGRISGELAAAEGELQRLTIVSEAAAYEYLAAEGRLIAAQEAAAQSAADLAEAQDEVEGAQTAIVDFAVGSYKSGALLTNDMVLLTSADPAELIQRAAFLDYISSGRLDVLNNLEVARVTVANSDSINRAAEIEMAAAERAAAEAKAAAEAAYANGAVMVAQVQAQKAVLDAQLQAAQVALLGVEGARAAYNAWLAQKAAEEAAA
ncbi:MAG: M23 family peptidase, partial [Geodermatophilaceae bacterium]|nr:M23 family peptidase [Geodermatophilaceae bacterium]